MRHRALPGRMLQGGVLVSLLTTCVVACVADTNGSSVNEMRWGETVQLASGETVQVERYIKFRQEGAVGMGLMAAVFESASLEIVAGGGDFLRWEAPVRPIFLDRDPQSGEWIVIAGSDGLTFWNFNGKPCPPQWSFRLRGGVWHLQPVPQSLIGRKPNLLVDLRVTDDREFSSKTFESEAVTRKLQQSASNTGVPFGMTAVGANPGNLERCKSPGPPRFADEFRPDASIRIEGEKSVPAPNLANFPRLQ
jgi:hypothetical protein